MDGNSPFESNKRRVGTLTLSTKMQPKASNEVYVSQGPPPFIQTKLTQAPRFGELFWCRLPKDAELPELWKKRPVVVISPRNMLRGTTTVLPTSTDEQEENEWPHGLSLSIDSRTSFVLCDKIMTLAVSRFKKPDKRAPRVPSEEMDLILEKMFSRLPTQKIFGR